MGIIRRNRDCIIQTRENQGTLTKHWNRYNHQQISTMEICHNKQLRPQVCFQQHETHCYIWANFKIQATTPGNKAELREATIIWVFKILKHNNTCCEQRTNRALNKSLVSMKKQATLMQQEILRKGFQEGSSPALTSNSWCFLKQQLVQMYRQ